jgi:hypothetical protein
MKTPRPKRQPAVRPYESREDTKAAVDRIHAQFEHTKKSLAREEEYNSSPEGVLKATLKKLRKARESAIALRKELNDAIAAIERIATGK